MTLDEVAEATGASAAHHLGVTGKGVHVVILDSGYFPHAYFQAKYPHADIQVQRLAVSAYPGGPLMQPLGNEGEDLNGHGTAMVANVLALAPEAKITMLVCRSDLEALKHAYTLQPDVISVSRGPTYGSGKGANNDVDARSTLIDTYQTIMADGNAGLKQAPIVLDAVGNMGARGMLSLLPGVISVGGTYRDEHGQLEASSYTNAYSLTDEIYRASKKSPPGFVTKPVLPEITGLCGTEAHPDFLILPTQPGSELETKVGPQGWGLASGSSCATPQVAGACALLKQVNPKLTTAQALAILHATGTKVTAGHGHVDKDKGDEGLPGKSGLKADGSWSRLINMGAAVTRAKQLLEV
jgi:subtilisin family serine protease